MKRKTIVIIIVFAICLLAVGSGTGDEPKRVMKFISVMDLDCGGAIDEESCTALTDILIEELVNIGKYTVIDRANRDKILSEQGFQQTGCVDSSCSVEAGRMLGVGKIVVGSIRKVGGTYIVSLQLINVQTAALELAKSESCKCDLDGLIDSVRKAAQKLMGQKPVGETQPPSITPRTVNENLAPYASARASNEKRHNRTNYNFVNDGIHDNRCNTSTITCNCWGNREENSWVELVFEEAVVVDNVRFLPLSSFMGLAFKGTVKDYRVSTFLGEKETELCNGTLPKTKNPGWVACKATGNKADSVRVYMVALHGNYAGICEIEVYGME